MQSSMTQTNGSPGFPGRFKIFFFLILSYTSFTLAGLSESYDERCFEETSHLVHEVTEKVLLETGKPVRSSPAINERWHCHRWF